MKLMLSDEQFAHALAIARRRQEAAEMKNRPSAWGYDESKSVATHLEGTVSELAVSIVTGLPWHAFLEVLTVAGRKPPDVGEDIQVRSTHYKAGCLIAHPTDADDDRFVLVVVDSDSRHMHIVGWLPGRDCKKQIYWQDKSGKNRPAYFVPQKALRPIKEIL